MAGRRGSDVVTLHPVEVAFLHQGTDLAIAVACLGLYERGVVTCTYRRLELAVESGVAVDGHPLEQAVVSVVGAEGVTRTGFWVRMRARSELGDLRRHLIDLGLLRDRSAFGVLLGRRRTRAGEESLADARAAATEGAGWVATRQLADVRSVAPPLANALDLGPHSWTPRSLKSSAVVSRGVRRRVTQRRLRRGGDSPWIYGGACGAGGIGHHDPGGGGGDGGGGAGCGGGGGGCGGGSSCGGGGSSCGGGGCGGD